MSGALIPPGPGPYQGVLQSFYDAISQLQQPDHPVALPSVDLKTDLDRFLPSDWPNSAILCAEINSVACSTLVAGTWTWLRADGSAI